MEACEKLMTTLNELGMDPYRQAVSISGVSRLLIFKYAQEKDCVFPSFSPKHKQYNYLLKTQLCAGETCFVSSV